MVSLVPETFSWKVKERYHGVRRKERKERERERKKEERKERKRKEERFHTYLPNLSPPYLFLCFRVRERLRGGLECRCQRKEVGREGSK